jgi:hypothetical protein
MNSKVLVSPPGYVGCLPGTSTMQELRPGTDRYPGSQVPVRTRYQVPVEICTVSSSLHCLIELLRIF